ncbi:MAG: hypothetical protein JWM28_596 [Chitinophagaceae bacterium]|nr:hypothetical protein [Chitinophagaceae bacterium]
MSRLNVQYNKLKNGCWHFSKSKFIGSILFVLAVFISSVSPAQPFQVGVVEVYGNYTIPENIIREKLGVAIGDVLQADSFSINKEVFTNRLLTVPGVKRAHIAAVCCTPENKLILFAGIDERDSAVFSYRKSPVSKIKLPREITSNYNESMKIELEAIQKGNAGEDDSQGHALLNYPPAQPLAAKTMIYAKQYFVELRRVLHDSYDPGQRAVAAQVIAYAPDKKEIVNDLLSAVKDDDETVRNNAARALGVIAGYANEKPELGINMPATVFIDMLNSVVWTDRNKGGFVLLKLTAKRDENVLDEMKKKAVPALLQMAKWKSTSHAESFYFLAGRLAGFSNQEISDAFYSDKRDSFYNEMVKKLQPVAF